MRKVSFRTGLTGLGPDGVWAPLCGKLKLGKFQFDIYFNGERGEREERERGEREEREGREKQRDREITKVAQLLKIAKIVFHSKKVLLAKLVQITKIT
jgi:hypothetical protein